MTIDRAMLRVVLITAVICVASGVLAHHGRSVVLGGEGYIMRSGR